MFPITGWKPPKPPPPPPITIINLPAAAPATGVDPTEIHNALYGKPIALSALGLARIGTCGLIWGPYFNAGNASFAVSFGFPANVTGTRRVYEVSLDSKVAWELAAGSPAGALDPAGFLGTAFTCRFYAGTQTQAADPLEIAMFGAQAVAYRPQMTLWFENLPVADYDGKVPFVSAKIGDVTDGAVPADGINLGDALERIAASPWLELDSSRFQTDGIADIVQAMILSEDQSFLNMLQVTARVYRTLDIVQTDMLRVNDRGATVTPDLSLQRDHITADGSVSFTRQEESSVPRELELITIDPDADYLFVPSKAARPLAPVPVTSSVGKETISLPVVIGPTTRASLVTFAKYQEDNARKRVNLQLMAYGYELEPGDLFRLNVAEGFDPNEVWKVVESSHGANYVNEIVGEAILKCAIGFSEEDTDPHFGSVVLLLHANGISPPVDSSAYAHTITAVGGASVDPTIKVFGAGSFVLDGVDDSISASTGAEYDFSPTNTSPYTVELWARFAKLILGSTNQILIGRTSFAQKGWTLYNPAGTDELTYITSSNGSTFTATTVTTLANLLVDTWYHIAVDKDSTGKVRIWINGILRGSNTPPDSVILSGIAYPVQVGIDAAGLNDFEGHIDDVRITSGVSRYGAVYGDGPFPVPTAQFPDSA